jgi:hypothetical protein
LFTNQIASGTTAECFFLKERKINFYCAIAKFNSVSYAGLHHAYRIVGVGNWLDPRMA